MVNILGNKNTVLDQFMAQLRDAEVQKDSMRFRRNLERMGEIFAYEISKVLSYEKREVITQLGSAEVPILTEKLVLLTILRAGLPLHQGLLNIFDNAQNGFISAYRKYNEDGFNVHVEYVSCPNLENKTVILSDPMLASGESAVKAIRALAEFGKPKHIHLVCVLASEVGVEKIRKTFSRKDLTIWLGAIDMEMTAQAYLVPGLGDAGDLAFGEKE
jgi:uracil phosphoribosyltransferase